VLSVIVAMLIPTIAPPGDAEASRAVSRAIAGESGEDIDASPILPALAVLERCEVSAQRNIRAADGVTRAMHGHVCQLSIRKGVEPVFRTTGFFVHDGYQWTYYGATRAAAFGEGTTVDDAFRPSAMTPKQGALHYDGLTGAFGAYDPYARILDHESQDGFSEPDPDLTTAPSAKRRGARPR